MKIKESEESDKYLDLARELWKLWNMSVTVIIILIGTFGKVPEVLEKEKFGNRKTNRDHPDYNIIEIGRITEKNPRDLRRLAVVRTLLEAHQQTLVRKTREEYYKIVN